MRRTGRCGRSVVCGVILCVLLLILSPAALSAGAYAPLEAEVLVSCLPVQAGGTASHSYRIRMEAEEAGSPAPEEDTITVASGGSGRFTVRITEPGTYRYRVYEQPGSDEEITYDDTVYHVTVFVIQTDEGGLHASVAAAASGQTGKPDTIEFEDHGRDNPHETESESTESESTESESTESESTESESTESESTENRGTETDAPATPGGSTGTVQTGDDAKPVFWTMLLLISAATALTLVSRKRQSGHLPMK